MKKEVGFGQKIFLLCVMVLCILLLFPKPTTGNFKKTDPIRTASITWHCYQIPYTRAELIQIKKYSGNEKLFQIIYSGMGYPDLSLLLGTPKITFYKENTLVCLYMIDRVSPRNYRTQNHLA